MERAAGRCVDHFTRDLSRVQMGVAHPAMLDHLVVRAYGESDVSLPSLAQASVRDPMTLLLRVYDPEVFALWRVRDVLVLLFFLGRE
jgi:ribosome recycling factor